MEEYLCTFELMTLRRNYVLQALSEVDAIAWLQHLQAISEVYQENELIRGKEMQIRLQERRHQQRRSQHDDDSNNNNDSKNHLNYYNNGIGGGSSVFDMVFADDDISKIIVIKPEEFLFVECDHSSNNVGGSNHMNILLREQKMSTNNEGGSSSLSPIPTGMANISKSPILNINSPLL